MVHGFTSRLVRLLGSSFATALLLAGCGINDIDDVSSEQQALSTVVPGQAARSDLDGNGFPDRGAVVSGHYLSLYAYDAHGAWYWDLGDGRVQGTVGSVDDLDAATLTRCDYVINYRGAFDNDPFLDTGWITNHIRCDGYAPSAVYNTLFVHKTDPRYVGNPALAIWGDWEIHVDTQSGFGNWARPHRAP
jgi:hypothetical protein